jgi:hypothetical protein
MKLKEIIELVQQHHPHMGETEIRKAIARASDQFCAETEILKGTYYQNTTADKRYYPLDADILSIREVFLDGEKIPRLVTPPPIEDADTTGGSYG